MVVGPELGCFRKLSWWRGVSLLGLVDFFFLRSVDSVSSSAAWKLCLFSIGGGEVTVNCPEEAARSTCLSRKVGQRSGLSSMLEWGEEGGGDE